MNKVIRWGMIGCGDVAETKSGPGLYLAENSSLEMVMSREADLTEDWAKRHNVPHWTTNAAELINNPNVDAVYVATPPDSHLEYVEMVAAAGKPVFVEKPMAINVAESIRMVDVCEKAGVPLFVSYYRRALPRFLKVKEIFDSGRIGVPRFVHIQHNMSPATHPVVPISATEPTPHAQLPWRFKPEINGGGNFVDMATHMIDMVDYLLGPISKVEGGAFNVGGLYEAEDTVYASFMVDGKIPGTGQWCYVAGTDVDRIEIVGTLGAIRFSCFNQDPIEVQNGTDIELIEAKNPQWVHQPLIQSIVDDLLGKSTCPSKGDNSLRAMKVKGKLLETFYDPMPGT